MGNAPGGPGVPGGPNPTNQLELGEVEGEVQPEPLDMRFPSKGLDKQITYLVLFPIIFPLWLTLPDTRAERGKSFWSDFLTDFPTLIFRVGLAETPQGATGLRKKVPPLTYPGPILAASESLTSFSCPLLYRYG